MGDPNAGFLSTTPVPVWPSGWSKTQLSLIGERIDRRIARLPTQIESITLGRTMPDLDQVGLGSGKQFSLSVLFLDICGFSSWPHSSFEDQARTLAVLNVFMAEMLAIIHDYGGFFEKNTGDGLMAYFGSELQSGSAAERVAPAIFAATVMVYVNENIISPQLVRCGYWPVKFRVGIDYGALTIARVGIKGDENSFVAVGSTANIACKIMRFVPGGGICIGENVFNDLPLNWNTTCEPVSERTGFVYTQSRAQYRAWLLHYRAIAPYV